MEVVWNLAANHSLSMKGEFIESGEGAEVSSYTEQLTANGKLDWVGVWSCSRMEQGR